MLLLLESVPVFIGITGISSPFASSLLLAKALSIRNNVKLLVLGVPGARYKGFSTHAEAEQFYLDAKERCLVKIIRNPGDEQKFGPLFEAVQ